MVFELGIPGCNATNVFEIRVECFPFRDKRQDPDGEAVRMAER